MTYRLTEGRYLELVEWSYSRGLHVIWHYLEDDAEVFSERCEIFFSLLERLLREGRLKLADKTSPPKHKESNKPWLDETTLAQGSIEEQIARFKDAWPKSELEADQIVLRPYDDNIGTGVGMGLWFFFDACPYYAAWLIELNGQLGWVACD